MERMPYFVMAGLLIASLAIAIVGGGAFWVLPVIVWPVVIGYGVWDRRAKRREGPDESLAAH
jgi:Na+/melibiose symporter-like transporter